jgi:peptidoglycan-associated lipoprotein
LALSTSNWLRRSPQTLQGIPFRTTVDATGRSVEQLDRGDLEKAKSLTPIEPVLMNAPANPPPGEQNYVEPAPEVMSTPAPPPEEEMLAPPPPEPATGGAPPQVNLEEPLRATPTPAPVAAVVRKSMILSMGFNDLPFGFTDSSLPDTHQSRVRNMGRYLVKKKGVWKTLVVAGHTDERGSSKFNMDLSLRRAETVRRLLIEGGVPASRIKAVGYGETKPVDSRHNEKAWARNRRVELEFLKVTDSEAIKRTMDQ